MSSYSCFLAKENGLFGGCCQQLCPHSLLFGRKLYKFWIFFACKKDCSFCPVSFTLIRADKAVQGPLVNYKATFWKYQVGKGFLLPLIVQYHLEFFLLCTYTYHQRDYQILAGLLHQDYVMHEWNKILRKFLHHWTESYILRCLSCSKDLWENRI